MSRRKPERVAGFIDDQMKTILAARATLIGFLDCDDFHQINTHCIAYARDFKVMERNRRWWLETPPQDDNELDPC